MAESGRSVAIIERVHVGGTCINEGCMPSKAMVASARVASLSARGREFGVGTGSISIDMAAIRERKRAVVERMRSGSETAVKLPANVELIMGEAVFTGPKRIQVTAHDGGMRDLTASEWVFIN